VNKQIAFAHSELLRAFRRPHFLRGRVYEGDNETLPGVPGTERVANIQAPGGTRFAIGGDGIDRRETRLYGVDDRPNGATDVRLNGATQRHGFSVSDGVIISRF